MRLLDNAELKLDYIISQISEIMHGDFAPNNTGAALTLILDLFQRKKDLVDIARNSDDSRFKRQVCAEIHESAVIYVPILGFLGRSSNVRNAFEVHHPLSCIAAKLLGSDVKIVLSSEWEYNFFTYIPMPDLENFVLIGFPASESSCAWVLPLAGHELGHHVWLLQRMTAECGPLIEDALKRVADDHPDLESLYPCLPDKLKNASNPQILDFTKEKIQNQLEEAFADLVGLRLFGKAFLYTFHYFLSPNVERGANLDYPTLEKRAFLIDKTARKWLPRMPNDIDALMADLRGSSQVLVPEADLVDETISSVRFLSGYARDKIGDWLGDKVDEFFRDRNIVLPADDEEDRIREKCFAAVVPASGAKSLADIINAGWEARLCEDFWVNVPAAKKKKEQVLNDIILKSIEVMEFEDKTRTTIAC